MDQLEFVSSLRTVSGGVSSKYDDIAYTVKWRERTSVKLGAIVSE